MPCDGESTIPIKVQVVNAFGIPKRVKEGTPVYLTTTAGKIDDVVIPAGNDFIEAILTSSLESGIVSVTGEYGKRREPDAKPEFVRADPLEKVGGKEDLRACVGNVDGGAVATLWHAIGKKGTLLVAADPADVGATDLAGQPVALGRTEGRVVVPFGHRRTTVHFDGISAADVRKLLAGAKVEPRKPVCLWIQAEDFARAEGKMARGADATLEEPDAFGDVLVCTGRPNPAAPPPWYAEYAVDVPRDGRWALWARVRYPTGADHSFGIVRPGETVTLSGAQVLGNCGVNGKAWHWTGRGSGSTAVPPGLPIAFDLPAGRFVFRIHAREGTGAAATNPRLDLLCLTDDPDYRPTDADARAGLSRGAPSQ